MRSRLLLMTFTSLLLGAVPVAVAQAPGHDLETGYAGLQFPPYVRPPQFAHETSSVDLYVVTWNNGTSAETVTFEAYVEEAGAWNGTPHGLRLTPPPPTVVPAGGRSDGNLTVEIPHATPESHYNVTLVARWSDGVVANVTRPLTVRDDWYFRIQSPTNATYRSPSGGYVDLWMDHPGPNDHDYVVHYEVLDAPAGRKWSGSTGPLRAPANLSWTQVRVPLQFLDEPQAGEEGDYNIRVWYFTGSNVRHDVARHTPEGAFLGYDIPIEVLAPNGTLPPTPTPLPDPAPVPPAPFDAVLVSVEVEANATAWGLVEVDVTLHGSVTEGVVLAVRPGFPEGTSRSDGAPPTFLAIPGATTRVSATLDPGDAPPGRYPFEVAVRVGSAAPAVLFGNVTVTAATLVPPPSQRSALDLAGDALLATEAALAEPTAMAGVALVAVSLGGIVVYRRESLRFALAASLPLYTRLAKPHLLADEHRGKAHAMIAAKPGIHVDELRRALGLSFGAMVHHLRMLERQGFVTSRRDGRLRRFYVAGSAPKSTMPSPTSLQDQILGLLAAGPLTRPEIGQRLGLSQQGVSYHVKNLERAGRVLVRREGARQVVERVQDPVVATPEGAEQPHAFERP